MSRVPVLDELVEKYAHYHQLEGLIVDACLHLQSGPQILLRNK